MTANDYERATSDFDYQLPAELIAQKPAHRRSSSRLLIVNRRTGEISHDRFQNLGKYLTPQDLLVANKTKVVPARLEAKRPTGGAVEVLVTRRLDNGLWDVLVRPSRKLNEGSTLTVADGRIRMTAVTKRGGGRWEVNFEGNGDVDALLKRAGTLPLPPYIRTPSSPAARYQTVYAQVEGSIAAPTAGLHFSRSLLQNLDQLGIAMTFVTLHVGVGTFKPVTTERIDDHQMEPEWGEVAPEVAQAINRTRQTGGRVVAVGTTTTRLLESAGRRGRVEPFQGETDLFITPGYRFKAIEALITNFHLPRSTLLMLVSALAGRELVQRAYAEAIRREYRFYSFGDAMLVV